RRTRPAPRSGGGVARGRWDRSRRSNASRHVLLDGVYLDAWLVAVAFAGVPGGYACVISDQAAGGHGVTERAAELVGVGLDGGEAVFRALRAWHPERHGNGEGPVERFPCPEPCSGPCGEGVGHRFPPRLQAGVALEHDAGSRHRFTALGYGGAGNPDREFGHAFFPSMMSSKYRGRIVLPRRSVSRRMRRMLWRMIAGRSSMAEASKDKD